MDMLLLLIPGIAGLGALICFILVLIEIFRRRKTGLGIASVLCEIGGLVAFAYGWWAPYARELPYPSPLVALIYGWQGVKTETLVHTGYTTAGILCVTGGLIAFIYGLRKAARWDIETVMQVWASCIIVGGLYLAILAVILACIFRNLRC